MSMFNVPEQRLEPKEDANAELITNISLAIEEVEERIPRIKDEYEDAVAVLRDFKFIDYGLKAKIFEGYEIKIEHGKEDLRSMKNHLEELGVF